MCAFPPSHPPIALSRQWHVGAFVETSTGKMGRLAATADGLDTIIQVEVPTIYDARGVVVVDLKLKELTLIKPASDATLRAWFGGAVRDACAVAGGIAQERAAARARQGER